MQRGIGHFKEFLQTNYPELQLYREDLYYYYKHVKFNVVQVRNSIIMTLHVPLQHTELSYELDIYRLHKIPLAVPGSTSDFTTLSSDFYAIGYNKDADYYITFENVHDIPSDLLDLRHSNVILQSRNNNTSCALNLMEGNLEDIKRSCGYNIQRKSLKPTGYRLSEHALLLSNISVIRISCTNLSKTMTMDKIQVVFFLRCGCKLLAGDMVFYSPVFKCSTTENITALFTPSFTVNLAFLTEFFEANSLQDIAADHFLNEDIEVDLPKLSIATKQYDAKLAQGQELKYDMSILIN